MTRVLLVVCHPVAESFVRAAGERAIVALRAGGHDVEVIDIDSVMDPDQLTNRSAAEALRWASELVLVYPTWYGAAPAALMEWFESVAVEGIAWTEQRGRRRGLLRNITSVRVVTAHGSSKLTNIAQGESGLRFVRRTMRFWCDPRMRVQWVAFYNNDHANASMRLQFLDRVTRSFA